MSPFERSMPDLNCPTFQAQIARLSLITKSWGGRPPPQPPPPSPRTPMPGLQHDSDLLAKLVRDEVRRQTSFMTPPSRPSNSGVPSARNRCTTDALPICNKCNKVGHIARNCRTSTFSHPTGITYNPAVRQHAQTLQPSSPTFRPNAPTFGSQPRSTNPIYNLQSGN